MPDHELTGPVSVDHVAGNNLPCFLVAAVREVGVFSDGIFFGYSELGDRRTRGRALRQRDLWLESRRQAVRLNHEFKPSGRLGDLSWRTTTRCGT